MSKVGFLLTHNKVVYAALIASVFTSACGQDKPVAKASEPKPIPVKLQLLESSKVSEVSEFVGRLEAQQRVSLPNSSMKLPCVPMVDLLLLQKQKT